MLLASLLRVCASSTHLSASDNAILCISVWFVTCQPNRCVFYTVCVCHTSVLVFMPPFVPAHMHQFFLAWHLTWIAVPAAHVHGWHVSVEHSTGSLLFDAYCVFPVSVCLHYVAVHMHLRKCRNKYMYVMPMACLPSVYVYAFLHVIVVESNLASKRSMIESVNHRE